jgi:hypothetical protein
LVRQYLRDTDPASDGEYPLLGTMLLDGHRLEINYAANTVELT